MTALVAVMACVIFGEAIYIARQWTGLHRQYCEQRERRKHDADDAGRDCEIVEGNYTPQ